MFLRFLDSNNHPPDFFQNQVLDAMSTYDGEFARLCETMDRLRMR